MSDQALLQFEHAGTVLALIGSLVFVNHQVSLHVTESVVPLLTGGALVGLHLTPVFLGVKPSEKILVSEVLAHNGEFSAVLIYAVLGKIKDDIVIHIAFIIAFFGLVLLQPGFLFQ